MKGPAPVRAEVGPQPGAGIRAEGGFTLIELLVVVLILGILMAIAIPTFLSLTGGAKTNAAEADLTTATQDEAAFLTTNGVFDTVSTDVAGTGATSWSVGNVASMKVADAGVNWVSTAPGTAGTKSVSVFVSGNTAAGLVLYLETAGADGNYYWVKDAAGTLAYAETSAMATYGTPPATFTAASWKALASSGSGPSATTTPTSTASSATTATTTVASTSTSTSTSTTTASNGVTATASVNSSTNAYYGQNQIAVVNSSPMSAMSITINVASTPGVSYSSQYNTFWGGTINSANSSDASAIHYTFTANTTIVAGNWLAAAQFGGTGTVRVTSGDTWTVTSTSQGVTSTQSGTF